MRSKIYCNGYTGLRDFAVAWTVSCGVEWSPKISLPLPLQGLHSYLFPISPGASSFSFSDMVQKLSRFDLDVKYDMHCTSLIFHSASVSVNPTSRLNPTLPYLWSYRSWRLFKHHDLSQPPRVFAVHSNSKVGHTSSAASGAVALLFMT